MGHPFVPPHECEWKGIIVRFLYVFKLQKIDCHFIPNTVDVSVINQFRDWLSRDTGDYVGLPSHNALKLFLWLVIDYYNILDAKIE